MRDKIIEVIKDYSSLDSNCGKNNYTIHENNIKRLADEIVKLLASFDVVINHMREVNITNCVNCDKEKETHAICIDCLTKIINENKLNI